MNKLKFIKKGDIEIDKLIGWVLIIVAVVVLIVIIWKATSSGQTAISFIDW